MKPLAVLSVLLLATPSAAHAINEEASLAMHVMAMGEYLDCEDLCPAEMTCLDVNCDLSVAELEAAGGYGYVTFLAYNVDEVQRVEFYVIGWPIGTGTPDFAGPHYCPSNEAQVLGEPFEKRGGQGGMVWFPCQTPCAGVVCFSYLRFASSIYDWLPITLAYGASTFTDPPCNLVDDCTEFWRLPFQHEHGAVIGGDCEPIPNCNPGPSEAESESWGGVKALYR